MSNKEKYVSVAVLVAIIAIGVLSLVYLKPAPSSDKSSEAANTSASSSSSTVASTGTKPTVKSLPKPTTLKPSESPSASRPFVNYFTPSIGQYGQRVIAWGKNFEAMNTVCFYKASEKANCNIFTRASSRTTEDLPFVIDNPLITSGDYKIYIVNGLGSSNALSMMIFR